MHGLARIAEHIVDPAINPFMVECNDVPIGYIQSWDPHAEADHPCHDQPLGTRGIDQFIGEPELIGQGHGTAFIRLFVESLFKAGAPRVVTDPNPRNSRAIRAYAKAGFKEIDRRITISGEALLMARDALPSESLVRCDSDDDTEDAGFRKAFNGRRALPGFTLTTTDARSWLRRPIAFSTAASAAPIAPRQYTSARGTPRRIRGSDQAPPRNGA